MMSGVSSSRTPAVLYVVVYGPKDDSDDGAWRPVRWKIRLATGQRTTRSSGAVIEAKEFEMTLSANATVGNLAGKLSPIWLDGYRKPAVYVNGELRPSGDPPEEADLRTEHMESKEDDRMLLWDIVANKPQNMIHLALLDNTAPGLNSSNF